jgi:hypothetical protein
MRCFAPTESAGGKEEQRPKEDTWREKMAELDSTLFSVHGIGSLQDPRISL